MQTSSGHYLYAFCLQVCDMFQRSFQSFRATVYCQISYLRCVCGGCVCKCVCMCMCKCVCMCVRMLCVCIYMCVCVCGITLHESHVVYQQLPLNIVLCTEQSPASDVQYVLLVAFSVTLTVFDMKTRGLRVNRALFLQVLLPGTEFLSRHWSAETQCQRHRFVVCSTWYISFTMHMHK